MKDKKRWFGLICLIAVMCAAILFISSWLRNHFLPKVRLKASVTQTVACLKERAGQGPLPLIAALYQPDGKYLVDAELVVQRENIGENLYDMTVQYDMVNRQIYGTGTIRTSSLLLDISGYVDERYIAVASDVLTEAQYYGITFNTFSSDLRKVPELGALINDRIVSQWDAALRGIQRRISTETGWLPPSGKLPLEAEEILAGILSLPCETVKDTIQRNGEPLSCYRLDYRITKEHDDILWQALESWVGKDTQEAKVSFFLHGDAMVQVSVLKDGAVFGSLELDMDLKNQPVILRCALPNGRIFTLNAQNEAWSISVAEQDRTVWSTSISYKMDPETGAFWIWLSGTEKPVSCMLRKREDGICVETDELLSLLEVLTDREISAKDWNVSACKATIKPGARITAPEYINLDNWPVDTFLALLGGIGSLAGIRLN